MVFNRVSVGTTSTYTSLGKVLFLNTLSLLIFGRPRVLQLLTPAWRSLESGVSYKG